MTKKVQASAEGRRAILRMPGVAMLGVAFLAICLTPIAFTVPGMLVLYLIPIAIAYWLVRTRTTASKHGITVRTVFGERDLPWSQLAGLRLTKRGQVRAVTADEAEITLPTVRARHLPVLSLVSDGWLADPSGVTDEIISTERNGAAGHDAEPEEAERTDAEE